MCPPRPPWTEAGGRYLALVHAYNMYALRNNNGFNRKEIDCSQLTVIVRVTDAIADIEEVGVAHVAFRVASLHSHAVGRRRYVHFFITAEQIIDVAVPLKLRW